MQFVAKNPARSGFVSLYGWQVAFLLAVAATPSKNGSPYRFVERACEEHLSANVYGGLMKYHSLGGGCWWKYSK